MTFQLEPGDTGQAILPAPEALSRSGEPKSTSSTGASVKDQGASTTDETPALRVSRASIARKMREGVAEQGWAVYDHDFGDGTWLKAAERICQHLERKDIEVHR